jgi:hypothetical protein
MAYLLLVIWVVEVLLVRPKDEPAAGSGNEDTVKYVVQERIVDESEAQPRP